MPRLVKQAPGARRYGALPWKVEESTTFHGAKKRR
jgi:hypothetical protein